jgi:hypothetical protein
MKLESLFILILFAFFGQETSAQTQQTKVHVSSSNNRFVEPASKNAPEINVKASGFPIVKTNTNGQNKESFCDSLADQVKMVKSITDGQKADLAALHKKLAQIEDMLSKYQTMSRAQQKDLLSAIWSLLTLQSDQNGLRFASIELELAAINAEIKKLKEVIADKEQKLAKMMTALEGREKLKESKCNPKQMLNPGTRNIKIIHK